MNGPFAQVLESPLLVEFSDQLVRTLEAERVARRRFRDGLDEDRREEFINGRVISHVATTLLHADVLRRLDQLLSTFIVLHGLGKPVREQALVQFPRNDYLPDFCFWPTGTLPDDGPHRNVFPPPAFVIEVLSESTAHRDRSVKFEDYQAHGVKEYWIVDPDRRAMEQYVEQGGKYAIVPPAADGVVRSAVIPGFQMPAEAAFDDAAQMAALRQLMQG